MCVIKNLFLTLKSEIIFFNLKHIVMKKVYLFISLMLSALAVGCNNSGTEEQTPTLPNDDKKVTVTVNTTLPGNLTWAAGEKVAINGLESEAVTEDAAGGVTYPFVVSNTEAPLIVVSPFDVLSGLNELTLPAKQNYVADAFDREVYAMAGIAVEAAPESEETPNKLVANVELTPVVGLVTLPLTLDSATASNPVLVKSISFTANSNAAMNGVWNAESKSVTDEAGVVSYDIELKGVQNTSTTVLDCGEGVEINASAPTYFSLVVPAGLYTGGFEVVITDTEDHNFVLTLTEDIAVERGADVELTPSIFTVVEKAPATLTVKIGEAGINWVEGDAVVCNNTLSTNTVSATEAGTQSAQFSFDAVAYPYSVFYPAEYYTTSGTVRFHEEQTIVKNDVDHNLMVMAGYSSTNEVTLNNLCGVISIPVTNKYEGETIIIEKIEVASAQGDPLAGKYHINYRTGALTSVAGKSALVLKPVEGEFTIAPEETATVNIVVPKGNIRNGLSLNIYSSVGLLENHKIFPTGLTVRGGETATADLYEYKEIKIEKIVTAEELVDFAKCVNMGRYKKYVNEEGKVVLGGDIDMSTIAEWVPITGRIDETTGIAMGFDGKFDGCGFSIKNWVTTQPLFGYVASTGSVSNFTIDQSCGLVIPAEHPYTIDGKAGSNMCFGFAVATNFGTVENIINNAEVTCVNPDDILAQSRAAIVGYNAIGGYVKGCINNAPVTFDLGNHSAQTGYLGTVIGRAQSSADAALLELPAGLYNCENHGKLTVNILDSKTTKNFYIGGVSGSANSYTVTINCKNTADITWNCPYSGAAVVMGGVVSYSAGKIDNCHNEGNILFNNTGNIKGTCIGGIVCYQNGSITNCTNKGNITAYGKKFEGRNTIGSIDAGTNSTSSPAPNFAGIVALGYNSTGSPFAIDNCQNYGNISYYWTEMDASGESGRTQLAGVICAPCGDVTNCQNYGDIVFESSYLTKAPNCYTYVGGVVASDYYAKGQSKSSVYNCTNEGDITMKVVAGSTNAAGGIIGWPGAESNCTNVTQGCVNKGNIVLEGEARVRLGGIQGGSGAIVDCVNEGDITINSTANNTVVGGLAGFHSGAFKLQNSVNTGNVVCNVPLSAGGVGGMTGNIGNAAHGEGVIANNTINCIVKAAEGTCGVGMVCGHFNGKTKTIYFGSADEPLKIGGSLQIGDTTTAVTAANVMDPAVLGAPNCSNFDAAWHLYNCVLAQ